MWIARDKDGDLRLFSLHIYKEQYRKNPPVRNREYGVWCIPCRVLDNYVYGMSVDPKLFPDLTWEDEPIEVNIFTNEFVQRFGDACYEQGEQDACRFEYGEDPEGNLTIEDYMDSKNKTNETDNRTN